MSEKKKRYFTKEMFVNRPDHWFNKGLQLTEEQILEAMANSRSNMEAARWMGITTVTYKKYANKYIDPITGKTLFELHKNIQGKGIPRNWVSGVWKKNLDDMLTDKQEATPKRIARLKELLMTDGRLGYQCASCGFAEKRLTDMKVPVLLNFKNGKKTDWRLENLQWLCYNHYFLYIEDPFSNNTIKKIEALPIDAPEIKDEVQSVYQLDDFYLEHLTKLGLDGDGDRIKPEVDEEEYFEDDGSEFIDRV
jgi:hypothetical protein